MAVAMAVSPGTGPIVDTTAVDGKYHMFNPLCEPALGTGTLRCTVAMSQIYIYI